MRDTIFSKNQFRVLAKYDKFTKRIGYIVVNVRAEGFAHTHINDKGTAILIAKICAYQLTPETKDLYLLNSILRISTDKKYKAYIQDIIASIEYNVEPRYNYNKYPKRAK